MAVDSVAKMLLGTSTEGEACDPDLDLVECLKNATIYANLAIHPRARKTRVAPAWARRSPARRSGDSLDLVQVGDSRGYVIRKDHIRLATKDQSLVQQLVDVGRSASRKPRRTCFAT
jgi:serine/threonine protein phosphatase PrpC